MILATGLRQYAKMHQSVLARIADWDLLSKVSTECCFGFTVKSVEKFLVLTYLFGLV
jgi:hypothetical protein